MTLYLYGPGTMDVYGAGQWPAPEREMPSRRTVRRWTEKAGLYLVEFEVVESTRSIAVTTVNHDGSHKTDVFHADLDAAEDVREQFLTWLHGVYEQQQQQPKLPPGRRAMRFGGE